MRSLKILSILFILIISNLASAQRPVNFLTRPILSPIIFNQTSAKSQTQIKLNNYFRELKTVEVTIDGETYDFLFDTGGGVTVVSPQVIEKLNKEPYGYNVGFRMSGERVVFERCDSVTLTMGGIRFHQEEVA
ncbi:MAG: retropepsin-like aspartic protease, partial [Fulvivirga sp.]